MSSTNAILLRAQRALKFYLDGIGFAWLNNDGAASPPVILRGVTAQIKTLPAIIIECGSADHESSGKWTGNWIVQVDIRVRENADEMSEDLHLDHAGQVADSIITTTIAADINAAAVGVLTIQDNGVGTPASVSYQIVERCWESSIRFQMFCYGQ